MAGDWRALFPNHLEETLDYVLREMIDPSGGFYSTQDADSEGKEGQFFVWTPDEIRQVLGKDADELMAAYGVTCHGNFEAKNILEFDGYRRFQIVALGSPNAQPPAVPLLQDRGLVDGQATAYACRNFACQAPVIQPEGLWALLGPG
jgi:uncharacterized protein YyaL (SSP411 family)